MDIFLAVTIFSVERVLHNEIKSHNETLNEGRVKVKAIFFAAESSTGDFLGGGGRRTYSWSIVKPIQPTVWA